jgi:hypothetical protein
MAETGWHARASFGQGRQNCRDFYGYLCYCQLALEKSDRLVSSVPSRASQGAVRGLPHLTSSDLHRRGQEIRLGAATHGRRRRERRRERE